MRQIGKRKYPFLAAATLPLWQKGIPPICTKVTPPSPGPQVGEEGIILLKNRSGVRVPLIFGSGGYPLARKEAPTPQAIGRQNIPSDDNSTRSTGFGNAGKGG